MSEDGDVTYRSQTTLVVAAALVLASATVAVVALAQGANPGAILFLVAGCVGIWFTAARYPHEVVLHPGGELEFRCLVRYRLTSARAVDRIRLVRPAKGKTFFKINFGHNEMRLFERTASRELVDALLLLNPTVELRGYRRRM